MSAQARMEASHKNERQGLRIPLQFRAERPIEEGPFYPWVKLAMAWIPELKREDLQPSQQDLELISSLAYQNDELANALAKAILENGLLARELEQGLVQGVDSLVNPPQLLVEYLRYYEALPGYFAQRFPEAAKAESSGRYIRRTALSQTISDGITMCVGFFIGANYPAVGKSIVTTGSVASGSLRMVQTLKFVEDVSHPQAFVPRGVGIQACAKVRLAHAFARLQIARKGAWDEAYYGVPISEFDNMIFLSGLFMSTMLSTTGDDPAIEMRLRALQYGLGAPQELLGLGAFETFRFFNMCLAHLDDSPETAREVVSNFYQNEYFRSTSSMAGKVNRDVSFAIANLSSRMLYGNGMADDIGLQRWYRGLYLPWLAQIARQFSTVTIRQRKPLIKLLLAMQKLFEKRAWNSVVTESSAVKKDKEKQTIKGKGIAKYKGSFGVFKGKELS